MYFESEKVAVATTQPVVDTGHAHKQDIEGLKAGSGQVMLEPKIGDCGARQAELMQLAWGEHGRWWIFFGLGLCMLA